MPRFARRYRLVSQAGSGGMAEVWRAVDTRLDRTVAIKLLLPELAGSARARERAVAEARAAARINHPNVAAVFDVGHRPRGLRRPVPYLVMEYVDGETLDHRLASAGALDWRDAVRIAVQVADALSAAHLRRVVHRDIKPGNIMLTPSHVKVVDFGLSWIVGAVSAGTAGSESVLLGTPEYMAPEQLRGEPVTAAADMYAFGVVLFQMLTGALPWAEVTRHDLVRQRRAASVQGPVRLPPAAGVPAEIAALVDGCLADEADRRPSSRHAAGVLRSALATHAGEAQAPPPAWEAAAPGPRTQPRGPERPRYPCVVPWQTRPSRPTRSPQSTGTDRRPRRRAVLVAVVAALVAAGGWTRPLWTTPAATASGERPPAAQDCVVRYVGHRTATTFAAHLSIVGATQRPWVLRFRVPPGQLVTQAPGTNWSQSGAEVTLSGDGPLAAGAPASIELSGAVDRAGTGFPTGFRLDGASCQRIVSILTVEPTDR
ncbi:serine/threonine-protein kinase [Dactylosporangium sp. NPDC051484]|uniref:serine/threonine-protein kinase n=1 Tax=Dactylosporangium sp. NPDC051484 TaxID=3154942 RepID=UPI00344BF318